MESTWQEKISSIVLFAWPKLEKVLLKLEGNLRDNVRSLDDLDSKE